MFWISSLHPWASSRGNVCHFAVTPCDQGECFDLQNSSIAQHIIAQQSAAQYVMTWHAHGTSRHARQMPWHSPAQHGMTETRWRRCGWWQHISWIIDAVLRRWSLYGIQLFHHAWIVIGQAKVLSSRWAWWAEKVALLSAGNSHQVIQVLPSHQAIRFWCRLHRTRDAILCAAILWTAQCWLCTPFGAMAG